MKIIRTPCVLYSQRHASTRRPTRADSRTTRTHTEKPSDLLEQVLVKPPLVVVEVVLVHLDDQVEQNKPHDHDGQHLVAAEAGGRERGREGDRARERERESERIRRDVEGLGEE